MIMNRHPTLAEARAHFERHLNDLADVDQPHAKALLAATEPQSDNASERLKSAIRRITADAQDDKPNGPTEEALDGLQKTLSRESYAAFGPRAFNVANGWGAKLCEALAADTKDLREAAEAYFGENFSKP